MAARTIGLNTKIASNAIEFCMVRIYFAIFGIQTIFLTKNMLQKVTIDASDKRFSLNLKELIRYKDLFWTLTYRDFRVRYAQATLGFLWAFIQPLATVLILVLVFGRALKVETFGVPYPLYAMAGMTLWTYFAFVLNQSGTSIISAQSIITKIYFPKLIIPISKAIVGFVDLLIAFIMLIGMFLWYGYCPSSNVIFLPFFLVMAVIASLGVGVLLSALSVRFRDFQYIIPFLVQFGLYATPVAYPATFISQDFKWLYYLNPMAGIIEGFRWSLFEEVQLETYCYFSLISACLLFIMGLVYFQFTEDKMADIV